MFNNVSPLVNLIAAGLGRLHHALLPPICLLCGADGMAGRDLCAGCAAALPRNLNPCPRCALPLAAGQAECEPCQIRPRAFDRAFVPYRYQPPVDFLIRRLKFAGRLSHARLLGELLAAALAERGVPLPDCIVPVPLHPLRLRERGFNQALELARIPARRFGLPLLAQGLRRVRHTAPQTELDARGREANPLGAFAPGQILTGRRVALIDDVVTTGSTVAECARILRAAGAAGIEIWAIGRAGAESG